MHGGDVYRNKIEYDFSININPLGMPAKCIEALKESIGYCGRYPDSYCGELKDKLSKKTNTRPEYIIFGNGAAELIYSLCASIAFDKGLHNTTKALIPTPTFSEYESAILAFGGSVEYYETNVASFQINEDILHHITEETDIVFICNPNNPTGLLVSEKFMLSILEKCRETQTILCVDECFMQFVNADKEYSMLRYSEEYKELIVLNAFTKIYGMPGLRLGYAITSNEELLSKMRAITQPWNISLPAQLAGAAALEDAGYIARTKQYIEVERKYLVDEMSKGLAQDIIPGEANFIFFKGENNLYEKMLEQGILIRSCDDFVGLTGDWYRIGIRTHEENCELIRRWSNINGNT